MANKTSSKQSSRKNRNRKNAKRANPLKGFKPVLETSRARTPKPGYEAVSPTSIEALMEVSRDARRFYDMILEAGRAGMTRHEILRADVEQRNVQGHSAKYGLSKNVTARIAELRGAGWIRHKVTRVNGERTLVKRVDEETGKANTVLVAVPHFEDTFTDTRFKALRAAYQDAVESQKRHLEEAKAAKNLSLEYLRRIHVKLRKIYL